LPRDNETIGLACVKYLSLDVFASGPCSEGVTTSSVKSNHQTDVLFKERLNQYPLYDYASKMWANHLRGSDLEAADIVMEFLADDNKLNASLQRLGYTVPWTTGAWIAVLRSLTKALERHLKLCSLPLNDKDHYGDTLLSIAVKQGCLVKARHLLEAGADPNTENDRPTGWTDPCENMNAYNPLSFATSRGDSQMTELLLEMGASINHEDCRGRSALWYAAKMHLISNAGAFSGGHTINFQEPPGGRFLHCVPKEWSAKVVSGAFEPWSQHRSSGPQ